jgi:hypothetical protein
MIFKRISSVINGAWATLDEVGKPSPTTRAVMRTLAFRRIRLALLSDAIGADSDLVNLSTAFGAAIDVTVHFRLLRDRYWVDKLYL